MLSSIFPLPRPMPLGGPIERPALSPDEPAPPPSPRLYVVHQLRLVDLAALEAWAISRSDAAGESPFALLEQAADEEDQPKRWAILRRAIDAAEAPPFSFGSEQANRLIFATDEGLALQLFLSLRQEDKEFSWLDAQALYASIWECDDALKQWSRFANAAWAKDPFREAEAAIDSEIGVVIPTEASEPANWGKLVAKIMERYPGHTLEQVGNLTMSQWGVLSRGGEAPDHSFDRPENWTRDELHERIQLPRYKFFQATDKAVVNA